nr:nestin [Neomonachus schauinslandi]
MEGCLGEESFQMWELNRRLEAYLARVKALEEQNELLGAELGGLRAQTGDASWRARADDELAALRALVDQRWREKHAAEVARPAAPRGPPAPAPELEELTRQLGDAWRGAVRGFQERVARMETSLGQARERLGRAVQGAREGRRELQQLRAERGGLRELRAALEQRLQGGWQERLRATEKFQLVVDALEQEKQGLQSQIARVLEGRRQLEHLQMSLSLEVATYRTLLEAENSRLQTPVSASKAFLGCQDPKLELHFPGTPEGRHLGPLLTALSPTSLSLPLPDMLETPVPGFLKSQEFLQARTPTLASTPIPPTLLAPCAVTDTEIRAQDAPLSLLQPQIGRQQVPEALHSKAKVAIPSSILPGPEEPGGEQQEASTGQSPEDHTSLAPPLSPDPCSLEAKGREPGGSGMASRFQEEGEGQIWGLAEKEMAIEVKMVNSLQQETWQEDGDLNMKEIQDSQGPLEKETLKSVEEEIQEPLMSLEKQSHEALRSLEKENPESLRSLEEESLDTSKGLEKENQELLMSLEEKDAEVVRPLEKETLGLLKPVGKEDPQTLQSLEKENQEPMRSLEGNLETFLYPEKENQELVRSLEENFESKRDLEKETQKPLRSLEDENLENLRLLEKENQESLNSLEDEKRKTLRPAEKENQEPLRSLEEEDKETLRLLEKENQRSLRSLEEEEQETTLRSLEKENQEPGESLVEEDKATLRPLEKVKPEPHMSLGKDQKIFRPLENENQQLLRFLKEENVETMRSSETENPESLKSAREDLGILKSLETQESLWSPEEMNQETMKPLEKEIQEALDSVEDDRETLRPLDKGDQESLRSLGGWNLENLRPLEELGQESQRNLTEEETPEQMENPELPRSLEEEGQELPLSANQQGWEDVVGDRELEQDLPPGRAAAGQEAEAKLDVREWAGFAGKESVGHGQLRLVAAGEVWSTGEGHPGSPEPKEQRVPVEGASGEGGTEGFRDPEGQPEQVGVPGLQAPQGVSEVREPVLEGRDESLGGGQASPEVTSGLETAVGKSAAGSRQGPEQEVVGLEDPGPPAREEGEASPMGEEGLQAERMQGLEGPRKDPEEAAALDPELSTLSRKSTDPLQPPRGWEEAEPEAPWGAEAGLPAETKCPSHSGSSRGTPQPRPLGSEEAGKDAELVLGPPSPGPTEPRAPTPIPGDAPGLELLAEGSQEVGWGLEGSAEALGRLEGEQEKLGSEGSPEDLQEEGEENREDSEADELGETLPDSTPLRLYLRSPASPRWDLVGEQRPSPQGEAREEGWDPSVPAPEGCGAQPGEEEEECGQDSDLSEEFEDLETEGSLLPSIPGEAVEPPGQVPQLLLESAAWDGDGESDGFADEEESGEDGEEDREEEDGRESGADQWGPGSSVGPLPALSGPQRGNFLGSETTDGSIPWDDGLRGMAADVGMTALETESQDSTEPSGSDEESGPVPLEREDQVPGPLGTLSGVGDMGLGMGDSLGVNGQGPSLKEELECVNGGVLNGLQQSEGGGQGKLGGPEADQGSALEEEEDEGSALKAPWAGPPLHLGVGQFLKFTPREGDVDSWSSGED